MLREFFKLRPVRLGNSPTPQIIHSTCGFHVGAASSRDKCALDDAISRQDAAPTSIFQGEVIIGLHVTGFGVQGALVAVCCLLVAGFWILDTRYSIEKSQSIWFQVSSVRDGPQGIG